MDLALGRFNLVRSHGVEDLRFVRIAVRIEVVEPQQKKVYIYIYTYIYIYIYIYNIYIYIYIRLYITVFQICVDKVYLVRSHVVEDLRLVRIAVRVEGVEPDQQNIEQHPQRPHVDLKAVGLLRQLFRRPVRPRADPAPAFHLK